MSGRAIHDGYSSRSVAYKGSSVVTLGRHCSRPRMIEIDRRKCPPHPLAFLADRALFRGLGRSIEPPDDGAHLERPPIRESAPETMKQAVVHGGKIASPPFTGY